MPPRFPLRSYDDLEVPAYLVTDMNAPELKQWQREHPDWFIAGTWTGNLGLAHPGVERSKIEPAADAGLTTRADAGQPAWPFDLSRFGFSPSAAPVRARARDLTGGSWPGGNARPGSVPNTLGGQDGNWPAMPEFYRASDALFAGPGVPTPDPRIDEVKSRIEGIARRVLAEYQAGYDMLHLHLSATQVGTALHVLFAKAIFDAHIPNVEVEQSFLDGRPSRHGVPESIRTDVLLRAPPDLKDGTKGLIIAVWDFKTGYNASLSPGRVKQIEQGVRTELHLGSAIPIEVIAVRFLQRPGP